MAADENATPSTPLAETAPEATAAAVEATGTPAEQAPAAAEDKPKKLGFFARLRQSDDRIAALEGEVGQLRATVETVTAERDAARSELEDYKALEADFEAAEKEAAEKAAKAEADAAAAAEAQAKAEAAAAAAAESLPAKVAEGVTDAVASLGVPEGELPAAKEDPPGPGQAGEFAHLSGRERAAAAINAQFGIS